MKTLSAKEQHRCPLRGFTLPADLLRPEPTGYYRPTPAGECEAIDCYAPTEVVIEHPNWDEGPQEHCWVHALVYRKEDPSTGRRGTSWRTLGPKKNSVRSTYVEVRIDGELLSQDMKFEGWPRWE